MRFEEICQQYLMSIESRDFKKARELNDRMYKDLFNEYLLYSYTHNKLATENALRGLGSLLEAGLELVIIQQNNRSPQK